MSRQNSLELGKWGEEVAANFLSGIGYKILEANHRTPYGEIDLIAYFENTIVFVEVKTRASKSLGMPEISVTPRKRLHIIQSAEYYMQQNPQVSCPWRIDVIAVQRVRSSSMPNITHFENAIFSAGS